MKTKHNAYYIKMPAAIFVFFVFLIAFLAADFSGILNAQSPKNKTKKEKPAQAKKKQDQNKGKQTPGTGKDKKEKIVKTMPTKGGEANDFVYQPEGRRDPFWNLLKGKNVRLKREAKEGIAGLLIDELELEGIITDEDQHIALFKGPDGRPYDVRVGDNVYDGEVLDITQNAVIFKRTLTSTSLGGTKEKLITKRLVPDEEAAKK